MNATKSMPLCFSQQEWFAFVGDEFEGHSRLQEIIAFLHMGFGNAESIDHKRASELIDKAVEIFGKF